MFFSVFFSSCSNLSIWPGRQVVPYESRCYTPIFNGLVCMIFFCIFVLALDKVTQTALHVRRGSSFSFCGRREGQWGRSMQSFVVHHTIKLLFALSLSDRPQNLYINMEMKKILHFILE